MTDEPLLYRTHHGTRWHLLNSCAFLQAMCGVALPHSIAGMRYSLIPKKFICVACLRESQRER